MCRMIWSLNRWEKRGKISCYMKIAAGIWILHQLVRGTGSFKLNGWNFEHLVIAWIGHLLKNICHRFFFLSTQITFFGKNLNISLHEPVKCAGNWPSMHRIQQVFFFHFLTHFHNKSIFLHSVCLFLDLCAINTVWMAIFKHSNYELGIEKRWRKLP